MNEILTQQVQKLKDTRYEVDGDPQKTLDEPFSEVVFFKKSGNKLKIKVVFEDYIVTPFPSFDFHDKWNSGVPPYAKVMYGDIVDETKGMYKFNVKSDTGDKTWEGWCPKKSCSVVYI